METRKQQDAVAPRRPTLRRRSHQAPPPLTLGAEPLEGWQLLEELAQPWAGLLWNCLRSVTLWAGTAREKRAGLFSTEGVAALRAELPALGLPAVLAEPVAGMLHCLQDPTACTDEAVAQACAEVAGWAEREALPATAAAFAQAAALADPASAARANAAGRVFREQHELVRAESWFRVAVVRGRHSADWESYGRAYIGLANVYMRRGRLPVARRAHLRAYRAAHRHGLRRVEAMALHGLFVTAAESSNPRSAERYAAGALRAYGPGHPSLPALAHDVAYHWMQRGEFARALPVFLALRPHLSGTAQRLSLESSIARAAGVLGQADEYRAALQRCRELLRLPDTGDQVAGALLDLALGAIGLGQWRRAELLAQRALRQARRSGEAQVQLAAEAALASIPAQRAEAANRTVRAPVTGSGEPGPEGLALRFVRALAPRPAPA